MLKTYTTGVIRQQKQPQLHHNESQDWFNMCWLIEAKWDVYLSINYAIIGSDCLSSAQCQTIIWTNPSLSSVKWNFNQKGTIVIQEINFEIFSALDVVLFG